MDGANKHHTNAMLRNATIAAGTIVGIALMSTSIFAASDTSGASGPTAQNIFNSVVFVGAMVWFAANAFRWLQERLPRPANHIVFAVLAAFAFGIGARAFYDVVADAPSQTADAVYQSALAGSLIVAGVIALASAVQRPETTEPFNMRHFLLGIDGASEHPTTTLMHATRWLAILGGVIFAAAIFVSPTVVPVAIALTCAVRYACTLSAPKRTQVLAVAAAALAVVVILVGLVTLFPEDQSWFRVALLPSAILFVVVLAIRAFALLRTPLTSLK